jgi:HEAT repeat protein
MVRNDGYRRTMQGAWLAAVDGLAAAGSEDALAALKMALYGGEWWAPFRTAALRRAVATALRRVGSPDAVKVLEAAAQEAPRSARAAAREQLAQSAPRAKGAR